MYISQHFSSEFFVGNAFISTVLKAEVCESIIQG